MKASAFSPKDQSHREIKNGMKRVPCATGLAMAERQCPLSEAEAVVPGGTTPTGADSCNMGGRQLLRDSFVCVWLLLPYLQSIPIVFSWIVYFGRA